MALHGVFRFVGFNEPGVYDVTFNRYEGGSALKARRFSGEAALSHFLLNEIGVDEADARRILSELRAEKTASLGDRDVPDEELRRLGLLI